MKQAEQTKQDETKQQDVTLSPEILEKLKAAGITQSEFEQIEQAIKTYSIAEGSPIFSETEQKITKDGKTQIVSHQTVPVCASCSRVLSDPKDIQAACGICNRPLGGACGCSQIACVECGRTVCALHRTRYGMNSWICDECAGQVSKSERSLSPSTITIPASRQRVMFGDTVKVQCAWCGQKESPIDLTASNGFQTVACKTYPNHVTVVRMFVGPLGSLEIMTAPVKMKNDYHGRVELPDWIKGIYENECKPKMLKAGK